MDRVCDPLTMVIVVDWVLTLQTEGGAVATLLTSQTPDPEVGGSSPIPVTVLCP